MADIVDTARSNGAFTMLIDALEAAGLVETLKGVGPFTVFAPTDAAFAKLPAGTAKHLTTDIPKLTKILTYHVVSGKTLAADIHGGSEVATVEGSPLQINPQQGTIKVNDADVTETDIVCDNGVIHVIDTVLTPP